MGNTWEVWEYLVLDWDDDGTKIYGYKLVWRGDSVFRCVRAAIRAKRAGAGCIKIEWR